MILLISKRRKNNYQGNSKAVDKKNTITANEFYYNKIENTLNAKKNVEIIDIEKDITINADDITYFKNEEKIITKGNTTALIENKYNFESSDVSYFHTSSDLSSQMKTSIKDNEDNIYNLDKFKYSLKEKLLKGKNLNVIAKNSENKNDEYFFSEGFFNLEKKNFISKETKIKIHKDIFGNKENDPKFGSSSSEMMKNTNK